MIQIPAGVRLSKPAVEEADKLFNLPGVYVRGSSKTGTVAAPHNTKSNWQLLQANTLPKIPIGPVWLTNVEQVAKAVHKRLVCDGAASEPTACVQTLLDAALVGLKRGLKQKDTIIHHINSDFSSSYDSRNGDRKTLDYKVESYSYNEVYSTLAKQHGIHLGEYFVNSVTQWIQEQVEIDKMMDHWEYTLDKIEAFPTQNL